MSEFDSSSLDDCADLAVEAAPYGGQVLGVAAGAAAIAATAKPGVPPQAIATAATEAYGAGVMVGGPIAATGTFLGCEVIDAVTDAVQGIVGPGDVQPPADMAPPAISPDLADSGLEQPVQHVVADSHVEVPAELSGSATPHEGGQSQTHSIWNDLIPGDGLPTLAAYAASGVESQNDRSIEHASFFSDLLGPQDGHSSLSADQYNHQEDSNAGASLFESHSVAEAPTGTGSTESYSSGSSFSSAFDHGPDFGSSSHDTGPAPTES